MINPFICKLNIMYRAFSKIKKMVYCFSTWISKTVRLFFVGLFSSFPSVTKGLAQYIYFIYLFGVLRRFQHCTGHITTGSWKGRGNQYIEFVGDVYCKLPTNGKELPSLPLQAVPGMDLDLFVVLRRVQQPG